MKPVETKKLVFIFGPTCAGKTEIACDVAEGGGEIVSVDSMQVYIGLEKGTAKPTEEQLRRVPHHLVSVVPPGHRFSAGDFRRLALGAIEGIWGRGKVPFLVGGTGLYFRALEYELADAPCADLGLRESLYAEEERAKGSLYERLRRNDPRTAGSLHPNDLVRIVRALEIYELTGRTFSSSVSGSFKRRFSPLKIGVTVERDALYARIETRCGAMIQAGLAAEVGALVERGCDERFPSMKGLGYSHFIQFFKGCRSYDETVRHFVRDSKRYAKRQLTWFRKEPGALWFQNADLVGIRSAVDGYVVRIC